MNLHQCISSIPDMGSSESLPINQSAPPRAAHDQSLSTPGTASGHLSPPRPLSVYFTLPRYPPDSQHHHLPLDLSEIAKVTSIFTSLHLPVELVQRILEEAEYFMGCRRFQKKHVIVPSDSQQREAPMHWVNGQEKVLGEEIKMEGSGLSGGKGELWYLVSSPIGCDARPAEANHPLENWQWTEIHERGEADYEGLVRMGGQRRVWVRRIVLETLSRDQGWSSGNPAHYGEYQY